LPNENITAWLTVHDRCSYNFERDEFFIHLNQRTTNKTIMHELWHWYFYYTIGKGIKKQYGYAFFNDIKEALTVILNIEFKDFLAGVMDKGYSQHATLRQLITQIYQQNKDIYQTINRTLTILIKNRKE
jgi:hypothetical protein